MFSRFLTGIGEQNVTSVHFGAIVALSILVFPLLALLYGTVFYAFLQKKITPDR